MPKKDKASLPAINQSSCSPVVAFFAHRLQELTARHRVQRVDKRRKPRKLTPLTVHQLLAQQSPAIAPSRTQIYRLYRAEAAPTIVMVDQLARLFGVSPRSFLPEKATRPPCDHPVRS